MSTDYWYDGSDPAVALLHAIRRFRAADQQMRRHLESDMGLNATDTEAVRHIIAAERAGDPLTAKGLSDALHISSAATAKLLNRLTESGHVRRAPHPADRRSVIIVATGLSHDEVDAWLSPMHEKMLQAAHDVPAADRRSVIEFLDAMVDALAPDDAHTD
ncbi:MarR family transcriptional regulator [Corynebacterium sp.]|uniref:MarR family winged helix-turn-helix transcriptional regulator n=1 Tax=Corynebacterium sp. TaxID=1720 RepID=UPI0025BF95B8|nr:MarR family transcriptional regulator [Corynebacterium sp.]